MRLKKIEILGFKSFADKTKLEFDAGVTAVVGPNGCGKSNIADAFRWVFGEQSAKSMRGSKMHDVIFAGTIGRKPLNFAEVTITLTDIEGQLPIDYEEVAVTRRLHRSGESEYLINKQPVRLKDVQGLFLDSGMGKDAYSIFEQGKIDQVINLSPLERRSIFEEAAGILRFLQRKREALRKLEQADGNVTRVKDIHSEVERQIIVLEEQAEKALRYKENKAQLDKLEKSVLFAKWQMLQKNLGDAAAKAEKQEASLAAANAQLEALHVQMAEAKQVLVEAELVLRAKSEEVFKTRSAKEIKAKEKQTNQERLKEIESKEKRWQHELESMIEKRQLRQSERAALQKALKAAEAQSAQLESVAKEQREKVRELDVALAELRKGQQLKQQELLKLSQHEKHCESEMKQAAMRHDNARERCAQIKERQEKLEQAAEQLVQQLEDKQQLLQDAIANIEGKKSTFEAMEVSLQDLNEEISGLQAQLDGVQQEISEARARQKALKMLKDDFEGFSSGCKVLLSEAANPQSELYGKLKALYEYLRPKKGQEAALAASMRAYGQTLVVESKSDFEAVVSYARKNDLKDISLFCLETISDVSQKRGKAVVAPPAGFQPLLSCVVDNELARHFLSGNCLSDKQTVLQAIKEGAGFEVWTSEGALIDRRSVVFYAAQGENNVFLREAELTALEEKLKADESTRDSLEHILKHAQQKKSQLHAERLELDKVIRREEMKLVEMNFAVQKTSADLENNRVEAQMSARELQNVSAAIESLAAALQELAGKHAAAKEAVGSAHAHIEKLNAQVDDAVVTMKGDATDLHAKDAALQQALDEKRKHQHALHVLEIKDKESEHQEMRLAEEIEMGRVIYAQIQSKGTEVDKTLVEVERNLADVIVACAELEQEVAVRKHAVEKLEAAIHDGRQAAKKHEMDRHQTGIQSVQLESVAGSLEKELLERHQLTIEAARATCDALEKSLEHAEKQVKALRQQLDSAGDINMTSIEECDKLKGRYQFLNQQIDDLNVSKQELVAIITQLDGESRKIFKETFEKISVNFKKNFAILFNGGEADLQFTETGDVLEAGIEIIAKPPGKQMRSISLLSGGEKCLTAMALLFAIFEVKPAPFCILDEIDAPLDDTNVGRFVSIVKEYVNRCQFIIITHNKRTMSIADVIFGVSMEEKGVSKLLSIDFSKSHSAAPAMV